METELLLPEEDQQQKKIIFGIIPLGIITLGYALLIISFAFFISFDFIKGSDKSDLFSKTFVGHYLLCLFYLGTLIYNRAYGFRKSWKAVNLDKTIILINLFLISAFALNRDLPVFESSVDWLCVYLIITSLNLLSFKYFKIFPYWLNIIQYILLGIALLLYVYLSLFVIQLYLVGLLGAILFGIGFHIFVPLTLIIACKFLMKHSQQIRRVSFYWILIGFCLPIFYVGYFVFEWKTRIDNMEKISNQSVILDNTQLPVWLKLASSIKNDWITQRILKSNLVYTIEHNNSGWGFISGNVTWDEVKKHDPLVYLASMVSKSTLSDEDRVKILQTLTDSRHQANERLWNGDNLTTSYIVSDIDIYPELRLAYTEKYLNIKNNDGKRSWRGSSEEAIYNFQLPEGSVVTSLSLWINGKEEKAILTSKQKANEAYKTIVGIEQRDPSVIHWQEGNTVSVRIFPCTTIEERKFKIGISSALSEKDGKVIYKNITFRGPNAFHAKETSRIHIKGKVENLTFPNSFKKDKKGDYISEHNYDPELEINFKAMEIKPGSFSFNGFTYSLAQYQPNYKPFAVTEMFFDINNSWTEKELNDTENFIEKFKCFVFYDEEFIRLNKENWKEIILEMREKNFSLFPFHLIKDLNNSLVITKGKQISPHLSDFKESTFAEGISNFFVKGNKINVFNIKGGTSAYVSSLREFRGLEFAEGNLEELNNLITKKTFPVSEESSNQIILHDAGLMITKNNSEKNHKPDNAPDHLARLFAYNDIMRKVGKDYFKGDFVNEDLISEATTAYVVSPVSSLIVLETKEDYERFDIKNTDNSLLNASKKSSGAVPEPHEWMLIIIFVLLIFYCIRQSRLHFKL